MKPGPAWRRPGTEARGFSRPESVVTTSFFLVPHPAAPDPAVMKPGHGVAAARHRGARIQPVGVCRDHEFLLSFPPGGAGPAWARKSPRGVVMGAGTGGAERAGG